MTIQSDVNGLFDLWAVSKDRWKGWALCIAFWFAALYPAWTEANARTVEPGGMIVHASGEVRLERADARSLAPSGLDLFYAGDVLETGANGRLLLRLTDDTIIDLAPDTRLEIVNWRRNAQPERARLVVSLHRGCTRWLTRRSGGLYLLRGNGLTLRNISSGADFEFIYSDDAGSAVIVHAGTLNASNLDRLASLPEEGRFVRAPNRHRLEASELSPGLPVERGPMPREIQELSFTRWPWLFPDSPREDLEGAVLWAESIRVRYRERTVLPEPAAVGGLMPIEPPQPEPESEPEPEPEPLTKADEDQRALTLLASLIRQGAHQEANALAETLRPELEGEPDFDVLYARAALNVGEHQRAVFALERVTLVQPQQHDVRLMLVEAYMAQGNTAAARRQLDRLEHRNLTSAQHNRRESLDRQLRRQQLAAQHSATFTLGAELQYDTNINRGLNRSTLFVEPADGPAFTFAPDADARARGAPALQLQGSYQRSTPLSQRLRRNWQAGVTTRQSTFSDAVNYGGLLSVGLEHRNGRSGSLDLLPSWNADGFQFTAQAGGRQQEFIGGLDFGASMAWTAAENHSVLAQTWLSDEFDLTSVRTDWRSTLGINLSEQSQQNHLLTGGQLRPLWQPGGAFAYQGLLGLQARFYVEDSPLYGERRLDLQLDLEAMALRPLTNASVLTGRVAYNQVFSNQGLYEYYGALLAIGYQHSW